VDVDKIFSVGYKRSGVFICINVARVACGGHALSNAVIMTRLTNETQLCIHNCVYSMTPRRRHFNRYTQQTGWQRDIQTVTHIHIYTMTNTETEREIEKQI